METSLKTYRILRPPDDASVVLDFNYQGMII